MGPSCMEKIEETARESAKVDFKENIDFNLPKDRCEIIKDIVAMANSGGGYLLIGVKDDGTSSQIDVTSILNLDQAKIIDQIRSYTQQQFSEFKIYEAQRNGEKIAIVSIEGSSIPIVFTSPGTYDIGGGKQKTAFAVGTVYFRHGAKSEPGNSNDLRDSIERELLRIRQIWLSDIRRVVEAPVGSQVQIIAPSVTSSQQTSATPIRFTEDPNAPAYHNVDPNTTHPYRQKEMLVMLNNNMGHGRRLVNYDIQCIRQLYEIEKKPQYYYKPKYGTPQYSDYFVQWLLEMYRKNPNFFEEIREKCKKAASKNTQTLVQTSF
jgi:hypothetical protein